MKRILLLLSMAVCCSPAFSQRLSIGTDAAMWLDFGAMNIDASAAVSRSVSVHAGAALNPWTFKDGDSQGQFQMRQNTYWLETRWWPWHIYSGWWAGADTRYSIYNGGGIISRETEEGEAVSIGLWGGYAVMLSDRWNLDLGAALRGGWKEYTVYTCPVCGVKMSEGRSRFFIPDARIALQLIF
ncbi:MAG: DUF3575 domain-containing protein [Bacteroidales bacterium]|nr:DUF3575 domain-containing protein [Bacteroidales bacterium]